MKKYYSTFLVFILFLSSSFRSEAQCPNYCFTVSTTNACKGTTVVFTHTSSDVNAYYSTWSFGDGTPTYTMTVPTTTVSHTYTTSGNYSPSINVYNNTWGYIGYSYGSSGNIQINGLSGISVPDSVCPGDAANMCANTNQGGNFSTFWKFGDGSTYNNNNGQCASHTYTTQTTYTITVIAAVNGCPSDSVKKAIKVTPNAKPDANWWTNTNGPACPNQQIGFNTDAAASYTWTFGDGATANVQYPSHTYTATNTYTVTLAKTNVCGKTNSYSNTITISNTVTFPNQSWFKLSASSPVCPGSNVGFDAPGGYSIYQWNYGDGSPLVNNSQNYSNHTYGSTITTYTASVKITNACNKDTTIYKAIQISNSAPFPNQSWFKLDVNSPACPNSTVGLNAPGGFVNYTYNFGDGSPLLVSTSSNEEHTYGSTLTTYTVSVKVHNGCNNDTTLYSTVQIMNNVGFPPAGNNFQIYANNPYCLGEKAGIGAPGGYSNYLWKFGDGDSASTTKDYAQHTYTLAGTYSISVKITNTCGNTTTLYGTVVVDNVGSFPNYMSIEVTPNSGSCPNDIVSFRMNSSGNYSSYLWNFGDGNTVQSNGDQIQHTYTATATYTVSCKITNACGTFTTLYTTITVSNSSPVSSTLSIEGVQNPSCPNDVVTFVPKDGQSTYTYYWNFGDGGKDTTVGTGTTHTYTAANTYTVSVVAVNACALTRTVTMTQTISNSAVPSLVGADGHPNWGFPGSEGGGTLTAGCAGDAIIFYFLGEAANNVWNFGDGNTGTATEHIVVAGGDGGTYPVTIIKYSYAANGTYTVSLTLTNGCGNSATGTMVIKIGGNLLVDGEMTTSPPPFTTCAPIDFIGFGGANYAWDFGDGNTLSTSSPTVSHTFATQGIYVVSVLITNGCGNSASYSQSINVNGAGGPSVTLNTSSNPTCVGGTNGSASVNVSSGQSPYTYLWNDANTQTTVNATGLSAGLYYVTVTDQIGCSSNFGVSINNPAPIVLASSTSNSSCGNPTGSATVTITSGGTAPYSYLWSTGATTSAASTLGFGQYQVTVTDINACTAAKNISVSENTGATLSVNSTTTVTCYGNSNGAIDINVTGSTPPYTYAWSNGATTQDISGLTAGSYSVTVTDAGGCKATLNTTISQPSDIVAATSVAKSPTCGNFDGKATVTASGGRSPYTYLWDSNTGSQTTQTATGLPAGSYSVTVTDANGCSKEGVVSLSNSNAPSVTAVVTDVSCNAGSNGSINITVTGGTAPYLYTWNVGPPQTNYQDISGLTAGSYFVSINDSKGCQSFRLYTVSQPAVLTASVTNTGLTCNNVDGTATAIPSGGNIPYSYLWTGGQTTQTAVGLSLGSRTVTITDSKGCTTSGTTTITATTLPINVCMVTVDSTSTKNVIVWGKPGVSNIDSFRVYRLVGASYVLVGKASYSNVSMFTDSTTGVNPNITSYKYEIAEVDKCGGVSILSMHHKTMHVTANLGVSGEVNLIWDAYEGFPLSYYRIWRDSTAAFTAHQKLDSVPAGNFTYTDWTPPSLTNLRYYIEIVTPTTCVASIKNDEPMATNLKSSKSNVYRVGTPTGTPSTQYIDLVVSVYPNPNSGVFTIDMKNNKNTALIKVYNMIGEEVKRGEYTGKNNITMDLSKQPRGIYYVQVSTSEKTTTRKIIIE